MTAGVEVDPAPWRGLFWNYEECGGMLAPPEGEVAWPPECEEPCWADTLPRPATTSLGGP